MRKIYLFGDICNERAEKFTARLHELLDEGDEPITIYINSSGGSVTDALAIYDLLASAPCEIYTVGLGKVHSAAVIVLLAAPRQNRAAYPSTEFMSHDVSWKSDGPRGFLRDRIDQLERTVEQLIHVYARDTNLSVDEARSTYFTDLADHYFSSFQALEMGFISRVILPETGAYREQMDPGIVRADPVTGPPSEEVSAINSSGE